jgi:hypothetical protein
VRAPRDLLARVPPECLSFFVREWVHGELV